MGSAVSVAPYDMTIMERFENFKKRKFAVEGEKKEEKNVMGSKGPTHTCR